MPVDAPRYADNRQIIGINHGPLLVVPLKRAGIMDSRFIRPDAVGYNSKTNAALTTPVTGSRRQEVGDA